MSDRMVSKFRKNEKMVVCAYWLNGDMTVSLCLNSKDEAIDLLDNIAMIDGIVGLTVFSVKDMMEGGVTIDSSYDPEFKIDDWNDTTKLYEVDWVGEEDEI